MTLFFFDEELEVLKLEEGVVREGSLVECATELGVLREEELSPVAPGAFLAGRAAVDGDRLILLDSGGLTEVSLADTSTRARTFDPTLGRLDDLWVAPDHSYWLATWTDPSSQPVHYDPGGETLDRFEAPVAERLISIDGGPLGEGVELFLVAQREVLLGFANGEWRTVFDDFAMDLGNAQAADVAWTGPGRAVASLLDTRSYVVTSRERGTTLQPRPEWMDELLAVGDTESSRLALRWLGAAP